MKINRQEFIKIAGWIGAALLVAGYVRYSVAGLWSKFEIALLGVGAALLLLSIIFNFGAIRAYFSSRGGRLGANTALLTVAVLAILAVLNYLGYRHHKRIDLTSEQLYSLSDQTRKLVAGLKTDVKVIKFDRNPDQTLQDLMAEYKDLSPRLSYERIDPQVKPEIARQYNVSRMGEVIVAAGDRIERPSEASEQSITNALLKVTRESLKKVCFLDGHGERSLTGSDEEGFSSLDGLLKNENYETKTINLATSSEVPGDCAVLVIAGPKQPLLAPESALLAKYLDGGGKAMLLLDPATDPQLGDLLKAWNIVLGDNTVIDASAAGQMIGGGPYAPLVLSYGSHPITRDFTRTMTIYPLARTVKPGEASGSGVTPTTLLTTSEASWGETELKPGTTPELDEGKDEKGPLSIGVTASKTVGENKEARLIVIGDSDFATNRVLGFQRNRDIFLNSINWLAQDEELISIRPKSSTNRRVDLSASQQNLFFWLMVVLMPLLVIGAGVWVYYKRR